MREVRDRNECDVALLTRCFDEISDKCHFVDGIAYFVGLRLGFFIEGNEINRKKSKDSSLLAAN